MVIGLDNGLSPDWHQAIIWTNLSEILNENFTFSLKKLHCKMFFGKWCLFCIFLDVLILLQVIPGWVIASHLSIIYSLIHALILILVVNGIPDVSIVDTVS